MIIHALKKKWEVYRTVPPNWSSWIEPGDHKYGTYWTRKKAQSTADERNKTLRNGRSDENFAVFKVRKSKL